MGARVGKLLVKNKKFFTVMEQQSLTDAAEFAGRKHF
jgi:hypothetical protein